MIILTTITLAGKSGDQRDRKGETGDVIPLGSFVLRTAMGAVVAEGVPIMQLRGSNDRPPPGRRYPRRAKYFDPIRL